MTPSLQVLLAVLAAAVLSMPVYALSRASRRRDPFESNARGAFVLGPFVRSWFYWAVSPVVRISLSVGLGPTFYNLLGVAFGIGAGVAFASGHVTLGGWGVLLGGVADVLDGRVARARGLADRTGAFLDSTLDRFAEVGGVCRAGPTVSVFSALAGAGGHRDGRLSSGQLYARPGGGSGCGVQAGDYAAG